MLRASDYRVRPVPSGPLALRAARADPPDLILLDIYMPEMSGFEMCERLKADPELREIPVVFLTANTDIAAKVQAFALGGVDYLTKPFQVEELRARVSTHLEIQRQKHELSQSYERLAELEKLRDNLVHMIVHDMRSPLTGLVASLEFLKDDLGDRLTPQNTEDIDLAMASSRRITRMAEELLDVSRFEGSEMPLSRVRCDLVEVIRAGIATVQTISPDRDVVVECAAETWVFADPNILGRVVENLVVNGVKHAPAATPVVVSVADERGTVTVSVRDEGPGIPPELQEKIFEKFGVVRARYKYGSVGLGLTFCKLAVEAHGGQIGLESEEGQGSTFWFRLPSAPDAEG